jgi:hypothetical protein
MNSPQNNTFKLKINDYFRTINANNKEIKNEYNNENVEDENTEEIDEELSELASRIVKTSESIYLDKIKMNNINKIFFISIYHLMLVHSKLYIFFF